MEVLRGWLRDHPLSVGLASLAVGMVALSVPPAVEGPLGECLHELVIAVALLALLALVAGPEAVRPSAVGLGFSLRASLYLLVVAALPLVVALASLPVVSESLEAGVLPVAVPVILVVSGALAISVALFEEALFRGIVLGALVERFGGTRDALAGAVMAASVVFGLMHSVPEVAGGPPSVSLVVQATFRTLVTASIGMLLCALYLRTHNLWCSVLVHALNDAPLLAAALLLSIGAGAGEGSPTLGGAEASDALSAIGEPGAASALLVLGCIVIVLVYVPVVRGALRQVRQVDPSDGSVFSRPWEPREPSAAPQGDLPARPTPPWA